MRFPFLIQQLFAEFLIFIIVFSMLSVLFLPRPARAIVPVFETNPVLITDAITNTTAQIAETTKEWALDTIAWGVASAILQAMGAQVLNWVQNGQTPGFVKDWQGFLTSAGSLAYSQFTSKYFLPKILPNVDPAYRNLLQAYVQSPYNPLDTDLSRLTQSTLQSYGINQGMLANYQRDFISGGGWATFKALQEPNNNFYSIYLETLNAQGRAIAGAISSNQQRAIAGQGFLGQLDPLNWQTKTPGKTVGDIVQKNVADALPDRLQNADEIGELVVSILMAGFNRLITQGLQ